ncbi:ATP phosphoribosyltransferase regulatory subunit [Aestuariivirga sp.]|uniref:ATP phosphoribosyltransferase regulatory subunit n=1 Tax=Aestuariivirga sp. TaxID=2650926 RepID=UPI0025BD9FD3|nr:ATP phosphoribosyltransferase regulatory subunit [Aestuariivirga sp.]MCA3554972.1 ATP phosphoribosyltransferase regulatory subunit [Aestuariivirga sp.]
MAGKSSAERSALERQNVALMAVFERGGFDHIAPDIIQPADIFLERSGEDIRARTFVFTDPSGTEMCLRPDLTVPACRYHLSHAKDPAGERRYCYSGPAFRFPDELLSPREFTQAGIEWFGASEPISAEARVLKLAISALEAAGLPRCRVSFGDLGLFSALLEDTGMPARWRQRLRHHFWRPHAFRELLDSFCAGRGARRTSVSPLVDRVAEGDALSVVEAEIGARNVPLVGGRDPPEIAARLANKAADRQETPLARTKADTLNAYLAIAGGASAIDAQFAGIAAGPRFQAARDDYARRLFEMEELGLNPRRFRFAAGFGRELEYYTGFTFQIEADTPHGAVVVAGGGRYDNLLSDMGSPVRVPAVGCAIHTDRLKAVLA